MWAKKAIFFSAFSQSLVAYSYFSVGTLLQAHSPIVLAGSEFSYAYRLEEGFSFALRLPLLFHETGQVVYPTIKNPPGPKFFEKSTSAFYVLEEFSYKKKANFLGVGNPNFIENHDFLVWGNPFYNPLAPYVQNSFAVQIEKTELRSSPLSYPNLWFFRQTIEPFGPKNPLFLKSLKLKAQFFAQKRQDILGAGGISLENLFYSQNEMEIKQKQTFQFIWEKEGLWQYTAGFFWGFTSLSLGTGFIAQSQNHPYGPYLSYLTLGRQKEEDIPKSLGGYFDLSWQAKQYNFNFLGEIYRGKIFSLRSEFSFRPKNLHFLLGLIREGINSSIPDETKTFYVLRIFYFAVGDFLVFKSENFYNFYENLAFRAMLSLTWTF